MPWTPRGSLKGPKGDAGAASALTYNEVEFLVSGTFTPPQELLDSGGIAHVLLVAGGGGGGYGGTTDAAQCGGGGGGGEVIQTTYKFTGPTQVTIGAGGGGATSNTVQGADGTDTTIGTLTAQGGGGGGSSGAGTALRDGRPKGSGGGTAVNNSTSTIAGAGGGGGGAGTNGQDALLGAQSSTSIVWYGIAGAGRKGGSGGRGTANDDLRAAGYGGRGVYGFGGGGVGGGGSGVAGWFFSARGADGGGDTNGGNAVANTGGGGGGGSNRGAKATGGNGANGRAIIWWYTGAKGTKGDPGDPSVHLSIGTVTSGTTASATITGSNADQRLNLVLPKGDPGPAGTTDWNGITNKPATFPPAGHQHALQDLTSVGSVANGGVPADSSSVLGYVGTLVRSFTFANIADWIRQRANSWTAVQTFKNIIFPGVADMGNVTGSININFTTGGQKVKATLVGNVTATVQLPGVGEYTFIPIQDGVGGRTLTVTGVRYWLGDGTAPAGSLVPLNTTANGRSFVKFFYDGDNLYVASAKCSP